MATFLSEEFMTEATAALNDHAGFANAITNVDLDVQFITTEAPEGEVQWHLDIADGAASMARGTIDDADVTLTWSYETAVQISKGELNTQMAFMTGKVKVAGNMAKLMMNQAVFSQFTAVMTGMDVEF